MIDKFENWLGEQKNDLILWLPVFLGLGSAVYFGLHREPPAIPIFLVWMISGFIAIGLFNLRSHEKMRFLWFVTALIVFSIMSGFCLAKIRTDMIYTPLLLKETRPVMVEGDVVNIDKLENNKGISIILENVSIEDMALSRTPKQVKLTSRIKGQFNLGDRISALAKLMPLSMPVMPGAYDFRRHFFFDQTGATGFLLKKPEIVKAATLSREELFLEEIRKNMGDHIAKILPSRLSGIAIALITGERAAIEDDDWKDLRISGLAHIISISGLHVVLIAGPVFFFIRFVLATIPFIALRWPIKKIAAMGALIACSLYVGLVVPTVPTYRSLVMTGMGLIAIMMDRSPFSLRLISFAAILVLIIAPESIWSASFQLSFAAVLSLIVSANWTHEFWSKWKSKPGALRKFLIYLAASVFTTLVVSIITAPLSSYHFQQIPIYSVVSNALSIPLTGLIIMPMVIATFVLWPFGLQDAALKFMGVGIEWMLAVAHETALWPASSLLMPAWPLSSLVYFTIAGLSTFLLKDRVRWVVAGSGIFAGIVIIFFVSQPVFIISQSGNLFLVRDKSGTYLSSITREKFVRESWLKRLGIHAESVTEFPDEGKIDLTDGSIICGNDICRIETESQKISFGKDYYALRQDCEWANIIVTPTAFRDKDCKSKIYNKFNLMDSGAVAMTEDGKIETVADTLGIRPWSPVNDRFGSGWKARPESGHALASTRGVYRRHFQAQE